MKFITLLLILFLVGCKPFSLDENSGDKNVARDEQGKDGKFKIPKIEDFAVDAVNNKKCHEYENHTSHNIFLGKHSPLNPVVNCVAYNIDEGLKPLCEVEKNVEEEIKREKNDRRKEELELFLEQAKDAKANYLDHLYEIADPIYDSCGDLEDELDEVTDKIKGKNDFAGVLYSLTTEVVINSDCRRLYNVIDSKVNLACSGIRFSSFRRR